VFPVINENDAIAVSELMFTDNDELAGLLAAMMDAERLIILTNVDGVYNGDPEDPDSEVIHLVDHKMDFEAIVSAKKSSLGRGGMATKARFSAKIADMGIEVVIANGKRENILSEIIKGEKTGTRFVPGKKVASRKKWLANSEHFHKAEIIINAGASEALTGEKVTSLLPVGIISVKGGFEKGDIVRIKTESEQLLGVGKAEYSSEKLVPLIGEKNQKPIIHYDYLYLYDE
jgi:glutamate 5-kinase